MIVRIYLVSRNSTGGRGLGGQHFTIAVSQFATVGFFLCNRKYNNDGYKYIAGCMYI